MSDFSFFVFSEDAKSCISVIQTAKIHFFSRLTAMIQ